MFAPSLNRLLRPKKMEHRENLQPATTANVASPPAAPTPRKFFVRKDNYLAISTASLATIARAGFGAFTAGYGASLVEDKPTGYSFARVGGRMLRETSAVASYPRPAAPIVLYEFEACPFCRKVREACAYLDLDVLFLPTTDRSEAPGTYRAEAKALAAEKSLPGRLRFPLMRDPNTQTAMFESDDIIKYLFRTYGPGEDAIPLALSLGPLTALTCGVASLLRAGRGAGYAGDAGKKPSQPLEVWSYEGSPFCKLVRERLCELGLPHVLHTVARGSPHREELQARTGRFQAPYLEDGNTGAAMFESAEICDYLTATYGKAAAA